MWIRDKQGSISYAITPFSSHIFPINARTRILNLLMFSTLNTSLPQNRMVSAGKPAYAVHISC